ncbi:MAG: hypothetical protein PHR40_04630 [Bacteroidales bacterium]|nr:hypothetical protein [Bacteroidales bacterium]
MKWFEETGRGPFNDQREALRRLRKTIKRIASRKKSVAAGEQTANSIIRNFINKIIIIMGSKARWEILL